MNDTRELRLRLPPAGRLVRALALVYLPQLAALVIGPLTECSDCVVRFWQLFGVLPGTLIGVTVVSDAPWSWIVTVALTLSLWVLAFVLVRRPWTRARAVGAVVLGLSTASNAILMGMLLRM